MPACMYQGHQFPMHALLGLRSCDHAFKPLNWALCHGLLSGRMHSLAVVGSCSMFCKAAVHQPWQLVAGTFSGGLSKLIVQTTKNTLRGGNNVFGAFCLLFVLLLLPLLLSVVLILSFQRWCTSARVYQRDTISLPDTALGLDAVARPYPWSSSAIALVSVSVCVPVTRKKQRLPQGMMTLRCDCSRCGDTTSFQAARQAAMRRRTKSGAANWVATFSPRRHPLMRLGPCTCSIL